MEKVEVDYVCIAIYRNMKASPVSEDNMVRVAKAIMEKHRVGYEEAIDILGKLRLHINCDQTISNSVAKQAALLTAINTGKRAFLGGVSCSMPPETPCLVPWPGAKTINEVVASLGGVCATPQIDQFTQILAIGATTEGQEGVISVVCSGWRGGIAPANVPMILEQDPDFATGGILAAGLAVAVGFLQLSGISSRYLENPYGISLWRPDLPWTDAEAQGPRLESLPKSLWLLGLGHLGQAYLWNLGLLPYANAGEATILLQDFDTVVAGNFSSQLLSEAESIGKKKTRICASWLEKRGFKTIITERPFDEFTKRNEGEPYVALCGFDKAKPRRLLENAGFDLIVECALGGNSSRFDRIILHTFPEARQTPATIWAREPEEIPDPELVRAFSTNEDCGILAHTLAQKSVASSFVGAVAGAMVTGELLRSLHSGTRYELIQTHIRNFDYPEVIPKDEPYALRMGRSGYCKCYP